MNSDGKHPRTNTPEGMCAYTSKKVMRLLILAFDRIRSNVDMGTLNEGDPTLDPGTANMQKLYRHIENSNAPFTDWDKKVFRGVTGTGTMLDMAEVFGAASYGNFSHTDNYRYSTEKSIRNGEDAKSYLYKYVHSEPDGPSDIYKNMYRDLINGKDVMSSFRGFRTSTFASDRPIINAIQRSIPVLLESSDDPDSSDTIDGMISTFMINFIKPMFHPEMLLWYVPSCMDRDTTNPWPHTKV